MAVAELANALERTEEIELTTVGRVSGRKISHPVWFVTDADDPGEVRQVVEKFRARYGAGEVAKYYSKLDVAVRVPIGS